MALLVICTVAFLASGLTLFSGFGLGTILMPAFAVFFPLDIAIALTAVVHFLNNIFKFCLLGKLADKRILLRFGIPAFLSSIAGAFVLLKFNHLAPLATYVVNDRQYSIETIKLVVALLMIFFVALEMHPKLKHVSFDWKYLPVGGVLSGFFGGLAGHQGALRGAFLIRCQLTKEAYIATGVVIACMVDVSRLSIYAAHVRSSGIQENVMLVLCAVAAAFAGSFLGNRWMKKITVDIVQKIVAGMLFVIALLLAAGII